MCKTEIGGRVMVQGGEVPCQNEHEAKILHYNYLEDEKYPVHQQNFMENDFLYSQEHETFDESRVLAF